MREEYDFSVAKINPYVKRMRKRITIDVDSDTIHYFKCIAADNSIPCEKLISLYLSDCASKRIPLSLSWK